MIRLMVFVTSMVVIFSCGSTKNITEIEEPSFQNSIYKILSKDSIFIQSHSGLVVQDVTTGEDIINYKGDQYFTPASNTKLLTLYTAYSVLSDRMIGLKYYENKDSLIIWGTGDPSFLNPIFNSTDYLIPFLRNAEKQIYISFSNFQDKRFGSGWAWDDYRFSYQSEKSSLPIYGNVVRITKHEKEGGLEVFPDYFETKIKSSEISQDYIFMRTPEDNIIYMDRETDSQTGPYATRIPYRTSNETIIQLLESKVGKDIIEIDRKLEGDEVINFYTINNLNLYRQLLQPSDNFVAEQLLLSCSSKLFDTMNVSRIINWSMDSLLNDMPHDFQWVDGSGLSRYNLTTPSNTVHLLKKIYNKVPEDVLFEILPTGGVSGTIRNLYVNDPPFVHAKTGSLRNNHALSGYFIGDSGKVYVFSFMNSNFYGSNVPIKAGMDQVLRILKEKL